MTTSANDTGCCLTVAGSDSGGNAGVQADLRVFHDFGLHGCTVFAALTAQNPKGVSAVHPVPPAFIAAQLEAVLGTYDVRAMKTGMLGDVEAVETVAGRLREYPAVAKVVDPVMVATSGARLISEPAVEALKRDLLPLASVITPNIPEAQALCGRAAAPAELARELADTFGCAVLVKGGHASGEDAVDVLCDAQGVVAEFRMPRVDDPVSTHGTGCSFAAALTACLARSLELTEAVRAAKSYVHDAIAASYHVGEDCGVLGFVRRDGVKR